VHRAHFRERL
jgi:uvrC: excinuclease ABC subunit C